MIEKVYNPSKVERKIYSFWEGKGIFTADNESKKPPFSIVIPPPNVTGSLHMGHALNNTLQDIVVRYKRMRGYNVLWLPGTDHAGIATQNVVERELAKEGLTRHDLGREKFIERVWRWKEKYGDIIIEQLKRLGASCDWSRKKFTMDENLSKAVREVFVRLYEEGYIYRDNYIINWCPRCQTALADIEVEHEEIDGFLYYLKYPIALKENEYICVATTRPETMLGDTAVAVNPHDPRYRDLIGSLAVLPIMGRQIPIIGDESVEMDFGTGAVKVTPAHDFRDFEIAKKHGLEIIRVMDDVGVMNENAGKFCGMDRFQCREEVIEELRELNLLSNIERYSYLLGHCYRCKSIVEPLISKQWFVKTKPLAEEAIKAVKDGRTRIIPEGWQKIYFDWLEGIRDWCISRQIWWGHQIPALHCNSCLKTTVSREAVSRCQHCGSTDIYQDPDVLDTWFSSALWPFSTLGWPDRTKDLEIFYPTSLLVTAFDILFFWVARMMMMGIKFMGDVPFRTVYIHALIRDAEGQKMSKSRGNVIDPLIVMDKYGTDAFRFTLTAMASPGKDIKFSEERIEGYRNFVNKLWNASRFVLISLKDFNPSFKDFSYSLPDRWIMSKTNKTIREVIRSLEEYHFNEVSYILYQFVWHEFCDWYVEIVKEDLKENADYHRKYTAQHVLLKTIKAILKMLHPIIPYVTEEIWGYLPKLHEEKECIAIEPFPQTDEFPLDEMAEREMEFLMNIIRSIRNIRSEMNIPISSRIDVYFRGEDPYKILLIERYPSLIKNLAKVSRISFLEKGGELRSSAVAITEGMEIFIPLEGIINLDEEERRLRKELNEISEELILVQRKLANEEFLRKAPQSVIKKEREKEKEIVEMKMKVEENLKKIIKYKGNLRNNV